MATRLEAAATRRALLDVASRLLDRGGVEAVTLREVGHGAGVSRSAAYRHFADKEGLLMALAAEAWDALATRMAAIAADTTLNPEQALRTALGAFVEVARTRAHLYRLMFARPSGDATVVIGAASRAQDGFLVIVSRVTGQPRAHPTAGLLLSAAHGIADLELSGHLTPQKWHTDGNGLLDLLVQAVHGQ